MISADPHLHLDWFLVPSVGEHEGEDGRIPVREDIMGRADDGKLSRTPALIFSCKYSDHDGLSLDNSSCT